MKVFDERFKDDKARYILQCTLATLSILIVLLILDAMTDAAIIAALGLSSFIAFTMPGAQVSRPRFMTGGYLVGAAAGGFCYYLSLIPSLTQLPIIQEIHYIVFGALAVGLAIFVMVITDTEHPPAAGLALGLVLDEYSHRTVAVVLVGVVTLSLIKAMLRPVLKDLL
ncbi:MAG: HPP family protein [Anaerolineae bacterium]